MVNIIKDKMNKNIILLPVLSLAAFVSCNKDVRPDSSAGGSNTLELEIAASIPALEGTKVTFDNTDLKWEGTEKLAVVFGTSSCTIASPTDATQVSEASANTTSALSSASVPGVFSGIVNLGSFAKEDIIGAVYPANSKCAFRYNSGARLVMLIGRTTQTQKLNNVLNGENAPLYARFDYSAITGNEGGKHTVEGIEFKWGCALMKFNVFGAHADMSADEIFKSISVKGGSSSGMAGTTEVKPDGTLAFNAVKNSTVKVTLSEACTIADKTSDNAVGVYMALLPRNTDIDITTITVETDKATYTKTLTGRTCRLSPGTVYPVGTDLSTYTRTAK